MFFTTEMRIAIQNTERYSTGMIFLSIVWIAFILIIAFAGEEKARGIWLVLVIGINALSLILLLAKA